MIPKNEIAVRCPFRGFDVCMGTACAFFEEGDPTSADPGSCVIRALGEISKSLLEMRFHQAAPGPLQNAPRSGMV